MSAPVCEYMGPHVVKRHYINHQALTCKEQSTEQLSLKVLQGPSAEI